MKPISFEAKAVAWLDMCYGTYAITYGTIAIICLPFIFRVTKISLPTIIFFAPLSIAVALGCIASGVYLLYLGRKMRREDYRIWDLHVVTYLFLAVWTFISMLLFNKHPLGPAHMVSYYARGLLDPINIVLYVYDARMLANYKLYITAILQFTVSISALLLLMHPSLRAARRATQLQQGDVPRADAVKGSPGVTVFGIFGSWVALSVILGNVHYFRPSHFLEGITGFSAAQILMSIVWLISVWGAFKLRPWARIGMVFSALYFIIETALDFNQFLLEAKVFMPLQWAYIGTCFVLFLATIFFFLHPNVMQQFERQRK